MTQPAGRSELRSAVGHCRGHFLSVAVFSVFVNLLMLTGPLFMLQIYDRVLTSRSEETLVALLMLVTGLFAMMGVLEFIRGRVLARAGGRIQGLLDGRVMSAVLRRSIVPSEKSDPSSQATADPPCSSKRTPFRPSSSTAVAVRPTTFHPWPVATFARSGTRALP